MASVYTDSQHIKGLADLQKFLDVLPVKMEANVMRGALRAGMMTVKPVAEAKINKVSGQLAAGLKVGTRARGGIVRSNLKTTGPHRFIAHLVEYGTRPHFIPAPKDGWLSFLGLFRKKVQHPGARPNPFLRPALDQQAASAVNAAAHYIRNRLESKYGLDLAHIRLEGDED